MDQFQSYTHPFVGFNVGNDFSDIHEFRFNS